MNPGRDGRALGYALLALVIVALAVAGYGGFVLYVRLDLPSFAGAGLFVLAAAAGTASFFSPCSFPLLVTLLAREAGADKPGSTSRALRYAAALSLGASAFLLLAGAAIGAGGAPIFRQITFTSDAGRLIRLAVGSFLILLGLIQMEALPVSFQAVADAARGLLRAQARLRQKRPTVGFAVFGFGYLLAGFG